VCARFENFWDGEAVWGGTLHHEYPPTTNQLQMWTGKSTLKTFFCASTRIDTRTLAIILCLKQPLNYTFFCTILGRLPQSKPTYLGFSLLLSFHKSQRILSKWLCLLYFRRSCPGCICCCHVGGYLFCKSPIYMRNLWKMCFSEVQPKDKCAWNSAFAANSEGDQRPKAPKCSLFGVKIT